MTTYYISSIDQLLQFIIHSILQVGGIGTGYYQQCVISRV